MPLRRLRASRLAQNVLSNYLTVVWMGGLSLALIPIYLRHLGPTQWGVVAVCMAMQALWGLLDAGLSQIMPRDVARHGSAAQAHVYQVYARLYALLGLAGFALGQLAIPLLISHWFNQGAGVDPSAELALRLVLVQFIFQFANNANVGFWNGREQQKLANLRQCFFGTLKHAGALGLVLGWRADAFAYLVPFAAVSALEWWINRTTVRKTLGAHSGHPVTMADLRGVTRESGMLGLGVLVGMFVTQIDRIVLSRAVSLESFGHYVIVANLGLAFMQLQYPLMRGFLPRIVKEASNGDNFAYKDLWKGILLLCVLPCLIVVAAAPWILEVWLGPGSAAESGLLPLRLILMAVALNAVYHVIYQRMVILGAGRATVLINIVSLVVVAPLCLIFAEVWGVVAGGLAWLGIAVVQLALGLWWWVGVRQR